MTMLNSSLHFMFIIKPSMLDGKKVFYLFSQKEKVCFSINSNINKPAAAAAALSLSLLLCVLFWSALHLMDFLELPLLHPPRPPPPPPPPSPASTTTTTPLSLPYHTNPSPHLPCPFFCPFPQEYTENCLPQNNTFFISQLPALVSKDLNCAQVIFFFIM